MRDRPEIERILNSFSNPKTRIFLTQNNINELASGPVIETPIPENYDSPDYPAEACSPPHNEEETTFVYRHINGLVLNINSIIKDDYFPGSRNTLLVPQLEGAPNFRVSRFTDRVFGLAIPMINGVSNTVEYIQKTYGSNNIVVYSWYHSCRHG